MLKAGLPSMCRQEKDKWVNDILSSLKQIHRGNQWISTNVAIIASAVSLWQGTGVRSRSEARSLHPQVHHCRSTITWVPSRTEVSRGQKMELLTVRLRAGGGFEFVGLSNKR
ncbi:hypothetical protein H6P81_008616 [Aristolochia fimbriata]|uniref:Uncharacterized protein n=1 Tax=Aristolochia fimbriata TaxID=158543 RepID=A0AAV7ELV4_ARIFI|nr:hypothetical protein H6P81_008616 [Aristolochia fimbriata]